MNGLHIELHVRAFWILIKRNTKAHKLEKRQLKCLKNITLTLNIISSHTATE